MKKTRKLIFMSLMVSYSLILYFIESIMPSLHFIAPGAKLGLTNIVSLVVLYMGGMGMAIIVMFMRIILASIFAGGFVAFWYSICGGLLAIISMNVMKYLKLKSVSEVGISVVGATFFNIGQLFVASLMIQNLSIFVYLPILTYVSVGTGIFVGICAKFVIRRLKNIGIDLN